MCANVLATASVVMETRLSETLMNVAEAQNELRVQSSLLPEIKPECDTRCVRIVVES